MFEIFDIVSEHIALSLAAAGYPRLLPLLDGKPGRILIGEPAQFDEFLPPRIVLRPLSGDFGAPDMTLGAVTRAGDGTDTERKFSAADRTIFGEDVVVELLVSSVAPAGTYDPEGKSDADRIDYEYTRALYHQLIASLHYMLPGVITPQAGTWRPRRMNDRIMREFIFRVKIKTPVLAELVPTSRAPKLFGVPAVAGYPHAPPDVAPEITDTFITNPGAIGFPADGATGSTETGPRTPGEEAIDIGLDPGATVSGPGCE